jgi:hypothetical protein
MLRRAVAASLVLATVMVTGSGCGPSYVKAEGVVKLDGEPIEGATVTFMSEDGAKVSVGVTDAAGKFVLNTGDKPGAAAGTYKVTIVKTPKIAGAESMAPGNAEYLKQMKDQSKDAAKAAAKSGVFVGKYPGSGGGTSSGPLVKSELPAIYGTPNASPLSAKIPSDGPIVFDLKSK